MQLALLWACETPGRVSFVQEVQKVLSGTGVRMVQKATYSITHTS